MVDPLAAEREELLGMIGELERLYAGLPSVKTGVSDSRMTELARLRTRVEKTKSRTELKSARKTATLILKAGASELIRLLFEILSYLQAAPKSRSILDDCWRGDQVVTRCRWADAA